MLSLDRVFASLPRTERGKSICLGPDPKGETFLYTNGNSVYIRSLEDPYTKCDIYTQHASPASVAKYSPSRFYIASGDNSGKLRIWDTTQAEHLLKNEFHVISGQIRDIAWSSDSQRLIVVGEGRERFGVAILADTGASVGVIGGHSAAINSVDIRRERPFRAVTASEDYLSCFYEGPPFKFKKQNEEHTNFVNCARYAPNGQLFATASSSGRIMCYEGKSSEFVAEIGKPAHKGGVYSLAFSPDSKQLVSVSGDKTAKLWQCDGDNWQLAGEWQFGKAVADMQVSCEWIGSRILTVSVDGSINMLDSSAPGSQPESIAGHSKPITAMATSCDGASFVTGSTDASLVVWNSATGRMRRVQGLQHKNQVQAVAVAANGSVYSVAIDDTLAVSDLNSATCQSDSLRKLNSQPVDVSAAGNTVAIVCLNELLLLRDGAQYCSLAIDNARLRCCALSSDASMLAVGTSDTYEVQVYSLSGDSAHKLCNISDRQAEVTALAYSPDGSYLAAAYADRHVCVYSVANSYQLAIQSAWCYHTAKVNCIAWAPDSIRLASGSLDCSIIVWNMEQQNKRITANNAHPMSQITRVCWLDNEQLVSAGQDANIKVWRVSDSS